MNSFAQPPSDFDVDFGYAVATYKAASLNGWGAFELNAKRRSGKLHKINWQDRTPAEYTQLDTHKIVANGARISAVEGKYWERSASSVLIACHFGFVFAEVSLALNRSSAFAAMRPWVGMQDFQADLREMGIRWEEQTVSNIREKREQGLPIPSAVAVAATMKAVSPQSPTHFYTAILLIMSEELALALPSKKRKAMNDKLDPR